jgi:DNA (cytosine-5)-methyltransferase 1
MIDYPAHLDAMWQKAIAPREPDAPTVVSTFAGGGGSMTGYLMAGFRDLLAIEWDDNAVATLRANYPELDIYHGDIAKITVEDVLQRTGLRPGELDILDGSPPCQGFSTAGKRIIDDPRNQLFREYVRLLRGLRPKVFVMENVSGMVKGKMKLVFVEILKELKASGYQVSAKLLNAMYFHVPQSRERMIFIGVRDDLGIAPTHPKAESKPVTVREAFQSIRDMGDVLYPTGEAQKIANEMRPGEDGCDAFQRLNQTNVRRWFGLKRLSYERPAKTIVKSILSGQIHPVENRYLAEAEIKRIGSYHDDYRLLGDLSTKWERIGNSVPPLFMEAIARHIRREILAKVDHGD